MGEVRTCLYFSVIFLCFHIAVAKPFFTNRFWCDLLCEDDDDISTTTTASSEDYLDEWCDDCMRRRRRPTPAPAMNPPMPGQPGMPPPGFGGPGMPPGPFIMMGPPQNGGGAWSFVWNPANQGAATPTPNGTLAPAATPAPAATTAAPGATTAAPGATTAAPAPAARK